MAGLIAMVYHGRVLVHNTKLLISLGMAVMEIAAGFMACHTLAEVVVFDERHHANGFPT